MDSAQYVMAILSSLMSRNNQERRDAEIRFHGLFEPSTTTLVEESCKKLLQVMNSPISEVYRSFLGVLLRRAIEKYGNFLSQGAVEEFRLEALSIWKMECLSSPKASSIPIVLSRIAHIIAQLANRSPWPALLVEIVNFSLQNGSQAAIIVIAAFRLIEVLSDYCPEDISSNAELLRQFFAQCFVMSESMADSKEAVVFRTACAKATAACIVSFEDETIRDSFKPALNPIISVLNSIFSSGKDCSEADATSIMEYLCTIAQEQPVFFKTSMDNVSRIMLAVVRSNNFEFSTRTLALELLVTLTETAPALARRCEGFLTGIIQAAMVLMVEIEEEDHEWAKGKYSEEASDENFCAGDEAIERIATGLGGKTISETVLSIAQAYSSDGRWQFRRAAVAGMCRLAEGSTKHFKQFFSQAMAFLCAAVRDSSPRVQYEAIQSVGRFAELFPDSIQLLVNTFLPLLTMILQNAASCDRVRGHAASALINLLDPEACDTSILLPFLDPLLAAMVQTFQTSSIEVQTPCLNLLGCIAKVSNESFCPYYHVFMPGVKAILAAATGPEQVLLRGKAIECAGIVGESVGKNMFASDALEIMNILLNAMHSLDGDVDVTFEYILPACARISSVLGAGFTQFLPFVMDPLLKGAMQEIQFSMVDADVDDTEGEIIQDEETGIESAIVSLGGGVKKKVTLNTTAIQQKNQAARILFELSSNLKRYLGGFIVPALQALIALVAEKHSADVRASAALAMAKAIEAYLDGLKAGSISNSSVAPQGVVQECFMHLLQCLKTEVNATSRSCIAESLRDTISACFEASSEAVDGKRFDFLVMPDIAVSRKLVQEVLELCGESINRRAALVEKGNPRAGKASTSSDSGDRFEKEDLDRSAATEKESVREEEEVLACLSDAIGCMIKIHGEKIMPMFDSLVAPAFAPYLATSQSPSLQAIAVCLLDDAIEFGGVSSHKYIASLLPTLMENTTAKHLVLRQSSTYGIAKAIEAAPEIICQDLPRVLTCLHSILQLAPNKASTAAAEDEDDDQDEDDDNGGTIENAVYALGVLCSDHRYRPALDACRSMGVDRAQLASLWLRKLPLREDENEAKAACKQLCDGIEHSDEAICGTGFCNLTEILRIFGEVFRSISAASTVESMGAHTTESACGFAHPETLRRMSSIVRQLVSGGSAAVAAEAMQSLGPELKSALQQAAVI